MADSNDLFGADAAAPAKPKPEKAAPKRPALGIAGKSATAEENAYGASSIRVLEGLEAIRMRPGMYVGSTGPEGDGLHHLFAEVIDNAMDEAVAGHATFIEVDLTAAGFVSVTDNGRGIPIDPHPQYPDKSALEVIMTMIHSGGKFNSDVYETSGGLHGV